MSGKKIIHALSRQSGTALIVSLILMLILSILAVQGMQTATLEEKMAGNFRSKLRAFQFAESALLEAQELVDEYNAPPAPHEAGTHGVWSYGSVDIKSETFWNRAFDNSEAGFFLDG